MKNTSKNVSVFRYSVMIKMHNCKSTNVLYACNEDVTISHKHYGDAHQMTCALTASHTADPSIVTHPSKNHCFTIVCNETNKY